MASEWLSVSCGVVGSCDFCVVSFLFDEAAADADLLFRTMASNAVLSVVDLFGYMSMDL